MGLHIRNQVRAIRCHGFSQVNFIPLPFPFAFGSQPCVQIIGGIAHRAPRRMIVFVAETHHTIFPKELLHPNVPQGLQRRQLTQIRRGCFFFTQQPAVDVRRCRFAL